MQMNGGMSIKW